MIGTVIAAVLGSLAVMALVSAVSGHFSWTRRRALDRAFQFGAVPRHPEAPPLPKRGSLMRKDGVARNAQLSAFFRRWDWSVQRAEVLERAALPLKVSEYLLIVSIVVVVGAGLALWLTGFWPAAIVVAVFALAGPEWYVHRRASQRINKFNEQLPGALQMMAVSLQSGFSISDAIRTIASDMDPPLADEFGRILDETRAGGSFEESLLRLEERINSPDLKIAIQALTVHARIGGNLGEILEQVAETMREREKLRRDVRSLTAQERTSANIIALLPIWVIGFMLLVSKETIEPLWTTSTGQWVAVGALAFEIVGLILTRRVTKVEV